jgi:glycosyltransferase involved in cell wall biosynthesis
VQHPEAGAKNACPAESGTDKQTMKVAYLTTDLARDNGWGRYSYEIIKRMPAQGIDPIVFTLPDAGTSDLSGIEVHPVLSSFSDGPLKPLRLIADWFNVRSTIKECALIHCLAEPFMPLAYLLSADGRPFAVSLHGTYALSVLKTFWKSLYYQAYKKTSAVLPVSRYTAQRVAAILPLASTKIRIVPNGVDTNYAGIPLPESHLREQTFLMVGHVKPRKGVLQAVEALAVVVERFPDAMLYIVGSLSNESYVRQVKERVAALGIEKSVTWLGRVAADQLNVYYKRVRGLVMPSMNVGDSFEGFGLVHLEANVWGVPAIGSLDCGNEDSVRDNYSGFLIKQGDIKSLSEAMMQLLDPAFDWDGMSAHALQFAQSMSWERVVDACVSVYREIAQT